MYIHVYICIYMYIYGASNSDEFLPALGGNMVDVEVRGRFGARAVDLLEWDGAPEHVLVVFLRENIAVVDEDDSV